MESYGLHARLAFVAWKSYSVEAQEAEVAVSAEMGRSELGALSHQPQPPPEAV